jgi:hypothetical protein
MLCRFVCQDREDAGNLTGYIKVFYVFMWWCVIFVLALLCLRVDVACGFRFLYNLGTWVF